MHRRTMLIGLGLGSLLPMSRAHAGEGEVEFTIPLTVATRDPAAGGQVGKSILLKDPANADRQISMILLRGLQAIGLVIEAPPLNLETFIEPRQVWRTRVTELGADWIAAHNRASNGERLRADRIYAVQYTGSYLYAGTALRMVLAISLFERSALGPLRPSTAAYSARFFADALEHSILAQAARKPEGGP